MDNILKQVFAVVTISVVLVLLLKNSQNTTGVINAIAGGAAQDVSVLQGNAYSGSNTGLASLPTLTNLQTV